MKGWKGHCKRVARLISDKADFKSQLARRDKQGGSILIKEAIHQENITIVFKLYLPNNGTFNFLKQMRLDLKTQIDPNAMIVGDVPQ
jgi:hypothetical protein